MTALAPASDDDFAPAFAAFLAENGYRDARSIGNATYACVAPFIYTHAIVTGQIGDVYGFEDRWCYHSYTAAKAALDVWDGESEPSGWHRHPKSGRRREDGDPAREEVRW